MNHAPAGEKKTELHAGRERGALAAELRRGKELLGALFGPRFLPVMVPPWNRLDDALIGPIVALGFAGLSRFGARRRSAATEMPLAQIVQVNTHVDPVDWHGTRGFLGEELVLAALVDHLGRRREGLADGAEATGILTHHEIHDEACWAFLSRLLDRLAAHPAARLVSAAELFAESKP